MKTGWKILLGFGIVILLFVGVLLTRWFIAKRNDPYATFIVPRLEMSAFEITSITKAETKMNMVLMIDNPSPFGVKLDSLTYRVYIGGTEVMKSTYPKSMELTKMDTGMIMLPLTVHNQTLIETLKKLEYTHTDSVNYKVVSDLYIDLPFLKNKPRHVEVERYLPAFLLPVVEIEDIKFEQVKLHDTFIHVSASITNRNDFDISFKEIYYKVSINGNEISHGNISDTVFIPAKGTAVIRVPVRLEMKEIASDVPDLLFNKDDTEYDFYAEMKIVAEPNTIRDSQVIIEMNGMVKELTSLVKKDKSAE